MSEGAGLCAHRKNCKRNVRGSLSRAQNACHAPARWVGLTEREVLSACEFGVVGGGGSTTKIKSGFQSIVRCAVGAITLTAPARRSPRWHPWKAKSPTTSTQSLRGLRKTRLARERNETDGSRLSQPKYVSAHYDDTTTVLLLSEHIQHAHTYKHAQH